jgi:hypothetical protein
MQKKIIVICILGMFLLLSCSALSTVGQKVETSEQTQTTGDDLPDLTIEIKFDIYLAFGRQIQFNYWIYNIGTGTAPKSWVVFRIYGDLEEDSYPHFFRFGPEGFAPGKTHSGTLSVPTSTLTGNKITAFVDPPYSEDYPYTDVNPDPVYGLIKESNEDNNKDTVEIPRARSYSSFSPLFLLLSRLPIFDEEFVQELRNNVDILSNGPGGSQFCDAVWDARAQVAYLIEWYFDHDLNFMAVFLIYSIAWPLQTIYETFCSPTGAS